MATIDAAPLAGACFGPGFAAAGEALNFGVEADALVIDPHGPREQRVPYDLLTISAGGFNNAHLQLSWSAQGQAYSLSLADPRVQHALLAAAPAALSAKLAGWQQGARRSGRRAKFNWTLLLFILGAPFLLLGVLLWQAETIAGWAADRVSVETEQKLGDVLFEQLRPQLKLVTQGEAPRVVQEIGERLVQGAPYKFTWHVAENPAVNAFAMPGGHVVVYTGLLRATDTPEELAGVLAHEIQHVLRRHSLRGLVYKLGWEATLALALGNINSSAWGTLATQLGELKFSRDQESDADIHGLQALKAAHIAPDGMVSFFAKLAKQDAMQPPALFSTHPPTLERMAALRAAIAREGAWASQPLGYEWGRVRRGE